MNRRHSPDDMHDHPHHDMDDSTMTSHLDDGRIVMLRDGDPSDPRDATHLDACAVCTAELEEARVRASFVSDALSTLDFPVDVTAAKRAVRERLDRDRAPAVPRRAIPIGRAAAILLVTAGAAAALPWSPISPWRRAPTPPASVPVTTTPPAAALADAIATASVTVDVADRIEISVSSASSGSALEIVWQDGTSARVAAPRGSRFALGAGRVEVEATEGPIRIEAPRGAELAVVVNGRTYLERTPDGLTVSEPAAQVSDESVRFLVREP
jgi:hypothetical protein